MEYGPIHFDANGLILGDLCPLCGEAIVDCPPLDWMCGCKVVPRIVLLTNWRGKPIQDKNGVWRWPLKKPKLSNKTKEQLFDLILDEIFEYKPNTYSRYLDEEWMKHNYDDWLLVVVEINKWLKDKENGW